MSDHIYVVIYDRPSNFSPAKLHTFISGEKDFKDWWHFLESTYIIISSLSLNALQDKLADHFNGISFLILPVTLEAAGGMLPQQAWDWISSRKISKSPWHL